ncbi:4-amino-4-deoxychorismate lyase [Nakamurella panacisegetis]|uniref:4-amino-4-deoxychorismate lyase n=2 Tax=Nakamurella panacisegetis TaxID=1090615 RepID=A0A1H0JMX7_9ACTN|nr:4-amino-4-deoxychorismate lyase [Nakamurella panacisegetis]
MVVGLLDGRVRSGAEPLLRPDDAGAMRGEGVFETILVQGGQPRDLPEHLARLAKSATMLDFQGPPDADWLHGVHAVLGAFPGGDLVLRLVSTRGPAGAPPTCYVTGTPVPDEVLRQRVQGVAVLLLDRGFAGSDAAAAPWMLTSAKTLSYAVNMAALRHARSMGADDVIFVGRDGAVMEAPTATVVVVRDRTLVTPPLDGILDGITVVRLIRAAQDAGWATAYERLTPDDLSAADGVFLVSSVRLVAPVTSIDEVPRPGAERAGELLDLLDAPPR